jgi:hypothetical protein
MEQG